MKLTEHQLRNIIRNILIERAGTEKRDDGKKVIGEPDATNEPMRDNPTIDQVEDDEIDEHNAIAAGGMAGVQGRMGDTASGHRDGPQKHLKNNK